MINRPLFLERLIDELDATAKAICIAIDRVFDSAQENTPCTVSRDEIIKCISEDIRDNITGGIPNRIVALKSGAREPVNRFHSAWLSKAIREAERKYGCMVGMKVGERYVRKSQFAELSPQIRVVAAGEDPEGAVMYILREEREFDPNMFDQDGFVKVIEL